MFNFPLTGSVSGTPNVSVRSPKDRLEVQLANSLDLRDKGGLRKARLNEQV